MKIQQSNTTLLQKGPVRENRIKPLNNLFLSQTKFGKPSKKGRMNITKPTQPFYKRVPVREKKNKNPTTFFSHNQNRRNPQRKENENIPNPHNPLINSPDGKTNRIKPLNNLFLSQTKFGKPSKKGE